VLVVVLLGLLGCWKLVAAELLSLGNAMPSGLVPHSGNILDLLLALGYLFVLISCWGRKVRCLTILPLILVSFVLVVLAVLLLLLLRELPMELLLMRTLILVLVLVSLRVTLHERVNCLRNGDDCCSRPAVHQSCASSLPSPGASSQSLSLCQSGAER
jgi:hypothetical protein